MVDYIFAAEFDILKGSLIRSCFPPLSKEYFDDSLLSSYMIPDGSHKREYDSNVFKYSFKPNFLLQELTEKINTKKIKTKVFRFHSSLQKWEPFLKDKNSMDFLIIIDRNSFKRMKFVKNDEKVVLELEMHKDLQFTKLDDHFYSLYSKEGVSLGLNFDKIDSIQIISNYLSFFEILSQENTPAKIPLFFYNLVKNKKDDNIKRGSLIRSIALCSKELNMIQNFEPVLKYYLNIFSNLDLTKSLHKLDLLLNEFHQGINDLIVSIPKKHLMLNPNELLEIPIDLEENFEKLSYFYKVSTNKPIKIDIDTSYFKNYTEPSLLEFIKKFGEKTMLIYNGILNEEKILFIGYECSIEETCNFVNSCITLVNPINVSERIFPYEHLLNLDFLQKDGYIAGVSNPIFNSRKQWWSLCCDLNTGVIHDNRVKAVKNKGGKYNEELCEIKANGLDNEFLSEILMKIKENDITEFEIRMHFYEYTRNFLDLCSNSSNLIDFEKDDKNYLEMIEWKFHNFRKTKLYEKILVARENERQNMSKIFGDKYLNVVKIINMFAEIKSWNDFELLLIYSTLIDCFNNSQKSAIEFMLKAAFSKKYALEALAAGFFSSSEDVLKAALKCFEKIEGLKEGGKILKKFSYYILFVYQNLKNKYMNLKI